MENWERTDLNNVRRIKKAMGKKGIKNYTLTGKTWDIYFTDNKYWLNMEIGHFYDGVNTYDLITDYKEIMELIKAI